MKIKFKNEKGEYETIDCKVEAYYLIEVDEKGYEKFEKKDLTDSDSIIYLDKFPTVDRDRVKSILHNYKELLTSDSDYNMISTSVYIHSNNEVDFVVIAYTNKYFGYNYQLTKFTVYGDIEKCLRYIDINDYMGNNCTCFIKKDILNFK